LSAGITESQFRQFPGFVGDLDGCDLAMGKGLDATREVESRPAQGLAHIARGAYNTVYRRQCAKARDHRDRHKPPSAAANRLFGMNRHDLSRLYANRISPS
jgi:hypothetical protein